MTQATLLIFKISTNRSNNMYRHLKVVHDDPEPYICVYKSCGKRFESSKNLREHVNSSHRYMKYLFLDYLTN